MKNLKIAALMPCSDNPITGGALYSQKLYRFLSSKYPDVDDISLADEPTHSRPSVILRQIYKNLMFLKVFNTDKEKIIVFEDIARAREVIAFNFLAKAFGFLFHKELKIIVMAFHTYSALRKPGLGRTLKRAEESLFLNSADAIVVCSDFSKTLVDDLTGGEKQVLVAHPGLNVPLHSIGPELKESRKKINLLFVGYLTPRKGVDTLIKCFNILRADYGMKNLSLSIAGDMKSDEGYVDALKKLCISYDLNGSVTFFGHVSNDKLDDLYSSADIFVFPSNLEGFGMVLIEAMYHRLPIVTTDVGAIPSLIRDGINGLLVPPQDPEKLALAIIRLIENPELRRTLGDANKQLVNTFKWDATVNRIDRFVMDLFPD